MSDGTTYTISQLAAEFDVTTRTIRFYEEKGMLTPTRRGQHRIYSSADRVRLQLILRGKRAGLSLDESCEVIDMYDPSSDNIEQYHALLHKVDEKQQQLESQIKDIEYLLVGLQEVRDRCNNALQQATAEEAANQ
jgi:DNA-binding transcriptional MerR regulator